MKQTAKKILNLVASDRVAKAYGYGLLMAYGAMIVANPAEAQSLKDTAVSIFTTLYAIVGVIAGIAILVHTINWKMNNFLGDQDPKKSIVNTLLAAGVAFGVVGILQAVKSYVNTGGSISSL